MHAQSDKRKTIHIHGYDIVLHRLHFAVKYTEKRVHPLKDLVKLFRSGVKPSCSVNGDDEMRHHGLAGSRSRSFPMLRAAAVTHESQDTKVSLPIVNLDLCSYNII